MSGAVGKRHRRRRSNRDLGARGQNESMEQKKIIDRVDLFMEYSYRYGYRYQYMGESRIDWESSIWEERMNKVHAARGKVPWSAILMDVLESPIYIYIHTEPLPKGP